MRHHEVPDTFAAPMLKRAFRATYKTYRRAYAVFEDGALVGAVPPGGLPPAGWWAVPTAPE